MAGFLLIALAAPAQRGPASQFQRYPFDEWASENAKPQIRWKVAIEPAKLSPHQRLITKLHVTVDGTELQKRQGKGQLILMVRFEDAGGRRYQTGNQTPVSQVSQGDKFHQLDYNVSAFVLPGDYTVSVAVCDARTLEHSFLRERLHVGEIRQDVLPEAWKGMPAVEFLPEAPTPDAWFLPQLRTRVRTSVETARPVRVELLVNTTPSEMGSVHSFRRNMELILPSLKVLMGIEPTDGSTGLRVIDLSRRAVSYEKTDLQRFDWGGGFGRGGWMRGDWLKLRAAFPETAGATVDTKTLAGQRRMLEYFAEQMKEPFGSLDGGVDAARVLIVLSAPVFFAQQDPPALPDLGAGARVFYISYSPIARVETPSGVTVGQRPLYLFADDVEKLLKPAGARVFRVSKPEEFRRAMGAILEEIGAMRPGR